MYSRKVKLPVAFVVLLFCTSAFSQTTEEGVDLYRSGEFGKAVETLTAVTVADKDDRFAWMYLGASLLKVGKEKEAVAAFKKGKTNSAEQVSGDDTRARFISKRPPGYTELARRNGTSGVVHLAVSFESNGTVGFILPIRTLPDGLTERAIAAARGIKFEPATKNGKPVTTVAIVEYTFAIY